MFSESERLFTAAAEGRRLNQLINHSPTRRPHVGFHCGLICEKDKVLPLVDQSAESWCEPAHKLSNPMIMHDLLTMN